ncbi:MAG: hypothetical protein QOD41_2306, partial [Cryptosporangiaceae bacterium]|nr:hypothetical protein [Cryptosporangiaceae bacterium]
RQLAEGFTQRGDDVTVLTYGGMRAVVPESGAGYRVIRLPSTGDTFEWSGRLLPELRRRDFDVCHVHNLHSTVAAGIWASRRRPYVLTAHYHGGGHTAAARVLHPGYRLLARRIVRGAAAVTAVSATEAALVQRDFGVDPVVVPNGIEPAARTTSLAGHEPPTIAVVSRLVRYKRVDGAVRALADLPDHVLHIIGDGPERASLLRLAGELGVRERVVLTAGRLSDQEVLDAVHSAVVHVNLSEAEAFSYTVLESLAVGTPVVVNGASALGEWAGRFPGAVLTADPDAPAAVAAAVRKLDGTCADVDLGDYALPAILDRYQSIYARAVAA